MDGLPLSFATDPISSHGRSGFQRTLKTPISCVGVGLHSGERVTLRLCPAPIDHGIVFRRIDLGIDIPARFDHVVDTRLATVVAAEGNPNARVGTIEHVLAALSGSFIDNALVEIDGPEPPILDGSSAPFVFLIDCAGIVEQDAACSVIDVRRVVRVTDGDGFAELRPARPGATGLEMAMSIDFAAPAIGRQALSLSLSGDSFRRELARARTFTLAEEVEQLRSSGLAKGGSLDNAVVVDQARVLNPSGLRMPDEFVRHKLLDAVGDLSLAGAPLRGRFVAHRSGHPLNNRLLRALFADAAATRSVSLEPLPAVAA